MINTPEKECGERKCTKSSYGYPISNGIFPHISVRFDRINGLFFVIIKTSFAVIDFSLSSSLLS